MSKKTFHMTVSTTFKVVVDGEAASKGVASIAECVNSEAFKNAPMSKQKAMTGLIYEASLKSEEHAIAEIIRFNLREELNDVIRENVCCSDKSARITAAPVRVRFEDLTDE